MSIDYFLSRVLRIFTLLSLGITLLFIYRGLPDPVAVHFGETGRGDGFLPKDEVFYLLAGVITVLNILILLLIKTVEKIPATSLGLIIQLFSDKAPENIKKIILYSLDGRALSETENTFLQIDALPLGVYILSLETEDGSIGIKKIIKN